MHRRAIVTALLGLALVTAACGDDDPSSAGGPGGSLLPPHTLEDLAEIFDPMVAELGYTTSRASLIDRTDFSETPDGKHLAIYFAPTTDITPDQYARDYMMLVRLITPFVFEQWPELASYDLCQEPFAHDGPGVAPSQTLFDLTREESATIDWTTVTLKQLLESDEEIVVFAAPDIFTSDTWREMITSG